MMIPLADLRELESDFLARANWARGTADRARQAGIRHRQHSIADMAEDAAKAVRELILKHAPARPVLQLVKDSAHG